MDLVKHLKLSVEKSCKEESRLEKRISSISGIPGRHYRHFMNNIFSISNAVMLDIGCVSGITSASAMCNNKGVIFTLTNWKETSQPKQSHYILSDMYRQENKHTTIDIDPWKVDPNVFQGVNIFVCDGYCDKENIEKSISYAVQCCNKDFIYICNNWNIPTVREGVSQGVKSCNVTVLYEDSIRLRYDDMFSPYPIAEATWGNGIYMAVFKK
jgi:hypothetical protein